MAITTQFGAISGRRPNIRYGPYTAERARTMLPGLMAIREREKSRRLEEEIARGRLATEREGLDVARDQARYQKKQGEKAEDIGLIGMGTELAILNRRNQLQAGLSTPDKPVYDEPIRGTTVNAQGEGELHEGGYNESSGGGGGGTDYWSAAGGGLSGGLIGSGIGRRLSKGKTWGTVGGGVVGGGIGGYAATGTAGGGVIGALAGGAVGGLVDLLL